MDSDGGFSRQARASGLIGPAEGAGISRRRPRSLISSSQVGSANRGRVLQALFDLGPTSRAELARQAGVNRTTISGIVQPLVDQGLLVEGRPLPASEAGGKPARPLWFAPDARPICAVLLMPDAVRSCLVTLGGDILAERSAALDPDAETVEPLLARIVETIAATLDDAHRAPLGIGVAVGGMIDTDRGEIVAINLAPVLGGLALGRALAQRFGLPVHLDHHPRAMLVGDRWFGQGRGIRTFAAIYTGEVLGGALYLDGHVQRGAAGAGGELGHTIVQLDGDLCRCGLRGCWETIGTLGWLRREGQAAGLPGAAGLDAGRLVALARDGTPGAAALLDRYARNIAVGIANLQQTVAPNHFVLHGDVVGGGATLTAAIAEHVRRLVPPRPGHDMTFVAGDVEDRAALRGAAGLVLSEILQFPI